MFFSLKNNHTMFSSFKKNIIWFHKNYVFLKTRVFSYFFHNMVSFLISSVLAIANSIKHTITVESDVYPNFKKENGSLQKLSDYRGIFLVPIISIIFEKLLKSRVTPLLEENMTKFQTGGVKNKGVVDNLFVLKRLIDHSEYLKKESWITFYDIEKCFDSLQLEDCINSFWRGGVDDDILYLIYLLNRKVDIIVGTPFGNTQSYVTWSSKELF